MKTIHITRVRGLSAASSGSTLAAMIAAAAIAGTGTAHAAGTIDNNATATGTYSGTDYTSPVDSESVPIADPTQALTVVKTGVINDGGDGSVDPGDTITYTVNVQNDSNVNITGVTPSEDGITFNGVAGGGTFGAFSPAGPVDLAPTASQDFTIVYTLTQDDIYRGAGITDGVVNTASASGNGPGGAVNGTDDSQNTIAADPDVTILKTASLTETNGNTSDGLAEIGDTITYTYLVTNTGNVPLTGITISDTHEPGGTGQIILSSTAATSTADGPYDETETTVDPIGNNADGGINGTWDTLGAGGAVTFTYVHTVTQAEFEDQ